MCVCVCVRRLFAVSVKKTNAVWPVGGDDCAFLVDEKRGPYGYVYPIYDTFTDRSKTWVLLTYRHDRYTFGLVCKDLMMMMIRSHNMSMGCFPI